MAETCQEVVVAGQGRNSRPQKECGSHNRVSLTLSFLICIMGGLCRLHEVMFIKCCYVVSTQ